MALPVSVPSSPSKDLLPPGFRLRLATSADLPALRELIPASVRALSQNDYTPQQIESAIRHVFGPDTQLIADGTYFVAETSLPAPSLVACGGWSRRRTLYGGDQLKNRTPPAADTLLNPAADAARVRAFFVHPAHSRQGLATLLLTACIDAARAAGFRRLELVATLPGVPFYERRGFRIDSQLETVLPDGTVIAFVQMSCPMENLLPGPKTDEV